MIFGIVGVVYICGDCRSGSEGFDEYVKKSQNPVSYLFYGQIAIYLGLAFFTTWFSNPTTWSG